jgi:hypothetical protein
MKHAISILMLLALFYGAWRMWPRTMNPYRAKKQDWTTAESHAGECPGCITISNGWTTFTCSSIPAGEATYTIREAGAQ